MSLSYFLFQALGGIVWKCTTISGLLIIVTQYRRFSIKIVSRLADCANQNHISFLLAAGWWISQIIYDFRLKAVTMARNLKPTFIYHCKFWF